MRAVRRHTNCSWVLLYIERWLKAPVRMPDGTQVSRVDYDERSCCLTNICSRGGWHCLIRNAPIVIHWRYIQVRIVVSCGAQPPAARSGAAHYNPDLGGPLTRSQPWNRCVAQDHRVSSLGSPLLLTPLECSKLLVGVNTGVLSAQFLEEITRSSPQRIFE